MYGPREPGLRVECAPDATRRSSQLQCGTRWNATDAITHGRFAGHRLPEYARNARVHTGTVNVCGTLKLWSGCDELTYGLSC